MGTNGKRVLFHDLPQWVLFLWFDRSSLGILGALKTDEWGIPDMCSDDDSWRVLAVVCDNANANKLVFRHLVAETQAFPRLLVVGVVCWAHNISNATRWSCGKWDFSDLLRLCNVV